MIFFLVKIRFDENKDSKVTRPQTRKLPGNTFDMVVHIFLSLIRNEEGDERGKKSSARLDEA
ncbi:MAG: hypothetical protein H6545_07120 [Bacteroidales bacterium]|jgi:hypothetical protein|nr:hypothetical protein [Bacteroidales bacterium]MCB9028864.1 hypothetical protein [Bacteroidales bacterium]MDD3735549.1 hypothetical protein [Bacteroidales bacterium]NLD64281.1 hypothetical protein [Bacteroidales bacterium]HNT92684.1 hypothetical protein [Bacteroidales bacterium]